MATLDTADAVQHPSIEQTRWRIDPARSRVAFRARTYWGLMTVNGEFERYAGTPAASCKLVKARPGL